MTSILLQIATRPVMLIQFFLSIFLLLRGHNLPGGGFIAGLVASSALIVDSLAFGTKSTRKLLRFHPMLILVLGLLMSFVSGLWGTLKELEYMRAQWGPSLILPVIGEVSIGTPFLFDIGVCLVVIGVTAQFILSFFEADESRQLNDQRGRR